MVKHINTIIFDRYNEFKQTVSYPRKQLFRAVKQASKIDITIKITVKEMTFKRVYGALKAVAKKLGKGNVNDIHIFIRSLWNKYEYLIKQATEVA